MENIDLVSLIPYVIVTTFSPGPNNISCASLVVNFGIKKSINYFYGIYFGFITILLLAGFFSTVLNNFIPSFEPIMRWVGAAYILYLAYNILKADYSFQTSEQRSIPFNFAHGFILQFLNPKGIIYALTLYSAFLNTIIGIPEYIILFAFILASLGFSSLLIWAFFGKIISKYLHQKNTKRFVNTLLALLLFYTAVKLTGLVF